MANIFTRTALNRIMSDEALTPEQRTEQVFSLYGRALEDGYVPKGAARAARETALEEARAEWEKGMSAPDVSQSDEYRALKGEFDAYRAMQEARASEEYRDVKPKFFETVYGMVNRGDGARSVQEQLAGIRDAYEEYFIPARQDVRRPQFGAPVEGGMPRGETGAVRAFVDAWGFVPKR